ncbi:MAG TPA: hypothetical protein VIA09_01765 [Nitrososphaeraceae archaeon]|jgi:hypothetical protein
MISADEKKCAMCGKYFFVFDGLDTSPLPTLVVEQVDGSQYTFDNAGCALMFKKFNAVY